MKRCFTYREGKSNKFWTVEVIGTYYFCTYGRIGTQGQTQFKDLKTNTAARGKACDMMDQKTAKGYTMVGDDYPGAPESLVNQLRPSTTPAPSTPAPTLTATRPPKVSPDKRRQIIALLADESTADHRDIARRCSVTRQQVAAIAAHVTMGTYDEDETSTAEPSTPRRRIVSDPAPAPTSTRRIVVENDLTT